MSWGNVRKDDHRRSGGPYCLMSGVQSATNLSDPFRIRSLTQPKRIHLLVMLCHAMSCCFLSKRPMAIVQKRAAWPLGWGSITRNVTKLLEEVYCGRNFTTKIFHMPSLLRAIVNSLIPEDKKSKVELLSCRRLPGCEDGTSGNQSGDQIWFDLKSVQLPSQLLFWF